MAKDICSSCGQEEPTKGRKGKKKNQPVSWICCDSCCKWFHTICIRASNLPLEEIVNYWYFCEKCTILGTLIQKQLVASPSATSNDIAKVNDTISELSEKLTKLQTELEASRKAWKKQTDNLRNQLQSSDQIRERHSVQRELVESLETKLDVIQSGAKLANTCLQTVNQNRIAINKIPYRAGENVKDLVRAVLNFLGISDSESHIVDCFRIPAKPSKWSDRSISPTIIVVFSNRDVKDRLLKTYFDNHKRAKLSTLQTGLDLEYRFTLNEVLSVQSFRIRNLALRLKQRQLVESVYVRNDSVSVRLPHQKRYTPITDTTQLLQLTSKEAREHTAADESSIFFDAVSVDSSNLSSPCDVLKTLAQP